MSENQLTDDTALRSFSYSVTLRFPEDQKDIHFLKKQLPGIYSLQLNSRNFSTYLECIQSCKQLMDDIVDQLNSVSKRNYKSGSEVNPLFSGQPTLSRDWMLNELARIWIYESNMEKSGTIVAIGQANIFGSSIEAERRVLN